MDSTEIKPFLRWAGGKTKLISQIEEFIPIDISKRKYWEPFLGAGSLFFKLAPKKGVISDLNNNLINCYIKIKEKPDAVHDALIKLVKKNSEKFYYETREIFNRKENSFAQAARFIYLNKTCYNGLYRVNLKGEFNVPYGKIEYPATPNFNELLSVSSLLQTVEIKEGSYESIVKNCKKGNFIYLDPPYPPLNTTSFFNNYTKNVFGVKQQIELSDYARELDKKGCLLLISNADTKEIRRLYKGWKIDKLNITRWISCKTDKIKVGELIIRNY